MRAPPGPAGAGAGPTRREADGAPAGRADATCARCSCLGTWLRRAGSCWGYRPAWSAPGWWRPNQRSHWWWSARPRAARPPVSRCPPSSPGADRWWPPASRATCCITRSARCSRRGRVWCIDPTGSTAARRSHWSPLTGCRDWHHACRMAADLCEAAKTDGTTADGEFWYATAAKLLAPLFFAAALDGRPMSDVVRWVDIQEVGEVAGILERADVSEPLHAAQATWCRDERTRSSVYTTAETVLAPFAHEVPTRVGASAFEPEPLLGGANTLFLCAPAHDQRRLRGYFTTITQQVLAARVCDGHEGRPPARSAAPRRARRGSPHRTVARARRPGRDVCVARHPVGHGLAGPGAGTWSIWRPRPDRLEQPSRQVVSPRYRGPRHARLRQPPGRRRGGDAALHHARPCGSAVDHLDDGTAPFAPAGGVALSAPRARGAGVRDIAAGALRDCDRGRALGAKGSRCRRR